MKVPIVGIAQSPVTGLVYCSLWPQQGCASWASLIVSSASRVRPYGYQKSGEVRLFTRYSTGFMVLPNCARLSPSVRRVCWTSCGPFSMNCASSSSTSGTSRPSSHTIGSLDGLPWSWKVHDGVMTKSPMLMLTFSPSTAV